ncbi:MAG: NCS2 family permease [Myxococcota bacterium]
MITSGGEAATPWTWFSKGDVDGFVGLAVDNLMQILLLVGLCVSILGFSPELIWARVVPGAGLGLLTGNFLMSWHAVSLSQRTGQAHVTALPYGISTISLFAHVSLVMLPVKLNAMARGLDVTTACELAWQVGLAVSIALGIGVAAGSLLAGPLLRILPRSALLSVLAGIALTFIATEFATVAFAYPLVALLPMGFLLMVYLSQRQSVARIPVGLWALILGTTTAWILHGLNLKSPSQMSHVLTALQDIGLRLPRFTLADVVAGFSAPECPLMLLSVSLPLIITNVVGNLQNIESAAAAGDRYAPRQMLLSSSLGTLAGGLFGCCFPNTIYVGHPGWKQIRAGAGYSLANGLFFAGFSILGLLELVAVLIPVETGVGILVWIGMVVSLQAVRDVESRQLPAVILGILPAIGAWGWSILNRSWALAGGDFEILRHQTPPALVAQLAATAHGFLLTGIIWSAAALAMLDNRWRSAGGWFVAAAVLSILGLMHSGGILAAGPTGNHDGVFWGLAYLLLSAFCWFASRQSTRVS